MVSMMGLSGIFVLLPWKLASSHVMDWTLFFEAVTL